MAKKNTPQQIVPIKKATKKSLSTKVSTRRVVFFNYEDVPGKRVVVAGSFNNWRPEDPLIDKDSNGIYRCRKVLKPGVYEYKFVVDGEWRLDNSNPDFVQNGLGSLNSVLVVADK